MKEVRLGYNRYNLRDLFLKLCQQRIAVSVIRLLETNKDTNLVIFQFVRACTKKIRCGVPQGTAHGFSFFLLHAVRTVYRVGLSFLVLRINVEINAINSIIYES